MTQKTNNEISTRSGDMGTAQGKLSTKGETHQGARAGDP